MMCELTSQPSSGAVKVWIAEGETRVVVQVPGMALLPSLRCSHGHHTQRRPAAQSHGRLPANTLV
jgi:hypothetical protein